MKILMKTRYIQISNIKRISIYIIVWIIFLRCMMLWSVYAETTGDVLNLEDSILPEIDGECDSENHGQTFTGRESPTIGGNGEWLCMTWNPANYVYEGNNRTRICVSDSWWSDVMCSTGNPPVCDFSVTVEQVYDINFWEFNSDDVFDGDHINAWTIDGTHAISHVSNFPSNSLAGLYLVVEDQCGDTSRHADIIVSNLVDQDVFNTTSWADIPAENIKLSTDGQVYFLDTTVNNNEVSASSYIDASFDQAIQLIERNLWSDTSWWLYGVAPSFELTIPQHQQPDIYKWTITWTVI